MQPEMVDVPTMADAVTNDEHGDSCRFPEGQMLCATSRGHCHHLTDSGRPASYKIRAKSEAAAAPAIGSDVGAAVMPTD